MKTDKQKPLGLLQSIKVRTKTFIKLTLDYMGPSLGSNKKSYVLVTTDNTTKLSMAKPTDRPDVVTKARWSPSTLNLCLLYSSMPACFIGWPIGRLPYLQNHGYREHTFTYWIVSISVPLHKAWCYPFGPRKRYLLTFIYL